MNFHYLFQFEWFFHLDENDWQEQQAFFRMHYESIRFNQYATNKKTKDYLLQQRYNRSDIPENDLDV
jgi:hypothetical protein